MCGFSLKVVVSLTINVRLPLIVLWHLSQKTFWLFYVLQIDLSLASEILYSQMLPLFVTKKTNCTWSLYCFSFSAQQVFIKKWPYLLLHLIPDSYMMYIKCSWSVCQLIWFINFGSQSVHGNTWLARGGAWFLFIKGMWGIMCTHDLFLFLNRKQGYLFILRIYFL